MKTREIPSPYRGSDNPKARKPALSEHPLVFVEAKVPFYKGRRSRRLRTGRWVRP